MGQVTDAQDQGESTRAIRDVNDHVARDPRVEAVMLAVADGVTIARKRAREELSDGEHT
jgi:caffeoyl-CoA O-methyltransferase